MINEINFILPSHAIQKNSDKAQITIRYYIVLSEEFLDNEKRMANPSAILFWRRYFCYLLGVAKTI